MPQVIRIILVATKFSCAQIFLRENILLWVPHVSWSYLRKHQPWLLHPSSFSTCPMSFQLLMFMSKFQTHHYANHLFIKSKDSLRGKFAYKRQGSQSFCFAVYQCFEYHLCLEIQCRKKHTFPEHPTEC